jgi:hypothetical protein
MNRGPGWRASPRSCLMRGSPTCAPGHVAQHAASAVKQALDDLGHPDAMPYLHADVNVFGNGVIELGRVTPETAALLAQALRDIKRLHDRTAGGHAA